jgi:hypothetical protein
MNQDHTIIYILGALLLVSVAQHIRVHIQLRHLNKQHNNMATFTDLQNAVASLGTAATAVQTAVNNLVSANAGNITSAEADTIVSGITATVTSLDAVAASITPAA